MPKVKERFGTVRVFHAADFPVPLRVPEGTEFVEPSSRDDLLPALKSGFAVFVRSCEGRVFIWREGDRYLVDHFFLGPPDCHAFSTAEEAADFAALVCD